MTVLGIMGGTFDPIHTGHIQIAQIVMKEMQLDGMMFLPDGDPPHKGTLAPARDRLRMVEKAIDGYKQFTVSDMEIQRSGTTYTVDTLRALRAQNPGVEYVYVIGADTLFKLETWHTFDQIPGLVRAFACVPRPSVSMDALIRQRDALEKKYSLHIELIRQSGPDISSSDVRAAVARALPVGHMVPPKVEAYIKKHQLYHDKMLDELQRTLTAERYRHTLGVERTAVELAQVHGVDASRARLAALLHDCAKCMPEREMKQLLAKHNMLPEDEASQTRTLMHAAAGMVLAREKYAVTDPEVLSAICWHTTGRAGMSRLEKLIYLADVIEPYRRPFPALKAIRAATWRDLDEGMRLAAERTLAYLNSRGVTPDRHTLELMNTYK